jgi:hypothetical protein
MHELGSGSSVIRSWVVPTGTREDSRSRSDPLGTPSGR